MVCGDSTIIAKVAMIVIIISVVMGTVAIFTPYWSTSTANDGTKIYSGLVVECNNTLGTCFSLQEILDKYGNSAFYTNQIWSLSLAMVGWVFTVAAMIIMIIYACFPNKITAIVVIILCLIGGGCIVASVIIYGVGLNDFLDSTVNWSLGLDAAAGVFALAAAVIVIINSCIIP